MFFSAIWLPLLSSAAQVSAFPALKPGNLGDITTERFDGAIKAVEKLQKDKCFMIDIKKPVDISGQHAFKAPRDRDRRGPCPGLNALANHGYISRTGITSFAEVVTAINRVMGMGLELSLILGVMGTVWTGNPLSLNPGFSIGGTTQDDGSSNILGNVLGLLGKPRGLRGAHNWLESDASLTRDDLYVTGNAWTMNMTLFRELHDTADEHGVITMDALAEQAAARWKYSIAHNPTFYYGPVTGMISRNAGILFLGRILSNHTTEHPDGILTQNVLKKFFAVYENDQGHMEYREGHETIPENWYRKPVEYGLVPLNLDIVDWIGKQPELGSIGGNTGTVNSFVGLNMQDITGGVVNAQSLLEDNNLLCFAFQVMKTFLPNSLSPLFATLEVPINLVANTLSVPLLSLACPAWDDIAKDGEPLWNVIQKAYDGARKAGSSL